MELAELRWQSIVERRPSQPEKEADLRQFLDGEFEQYWSEWRAKTYRLSEEEVKQELGRSFPVQKPDRIKAKER